MIVSTFTQTNGANAIDLRALSEAEYARVVEFLGVLARVGPERTATLELPQECAPLQLPEPVDYSERDRGWV